MEHHHHHHHRRDDDDDDDHLGRPNYPPPPFTHHHEDNEQRPNYPPPSFTHHHEDSEQRPNYPPPPFGHHHGHDEEIPNYPPTLSTHHHEDNYEERPNYPPPASVVHVSHVSHHHSPERVEHASHGGFGSLIFHHSHSEDGPSEIDLSDKPSVKVYCKADPDFVMAVQRGKVILTRSDPRDQAQHWYKDEKYSTKVKDSDGYPCFALVNKATGEALKHSLGATHPVQLIPYNANRIDESVLWTEGRELGDGYRPVRMVNNVKLNLDAFHGDQKSGGVHEGTIVVLWDWNKGDNQRWKIACYSS